MEIGGGVILDAGCGSGYSTELIMKGFRPSRLMAFDLMPEQIRLVERRPVSAEFFVGDMTDLKLPDATVDAVFVFGVLHRISNWTGAVRELTRVLAPRGVLLVEEPHHRFGWSELESGIRSAGPKIVGKQPFCLGYFRSYLCQKNP